MWNKKKSWLLLIRLRTSKVRLLLPISLAVLEETMRAVTDLAGVFSPLVRLPGDLKINDLMRMIRGMMAGIRSYSRLCLVEVDTDEVRVRVDLY